MSSSRSRYQGVACFDFDKTITCGKKESIKDAIQLCRSKGMAICIVTARPVHTLFPLSTRYLRRKLGFPDKFPIYWGSIRNITSQRAEAEHKARQLGEIQRTFGVDPQRVFLFDDKKVNTDAAENAGFVGVHLRPCQLSRAFVENALRWY